MPVDYDDGQTAADATPLAFEGKAYGFALLFAVAAALWLTVAWLVGLPVTESAFWLTVVTMSAAHVHYVIEADGSTGARARIDLALNAAQVTATMTLIALHETGRIDPNAALWLAAAVAFAHPVVTDWPHIRRLLRTRVSAWVPPACFFVDWGTAALVVAIALTTG